MNKKDICEVLYASYGEFVERRRKGLVWPIIVLVAGLAILAVNMVIDNGADSNNLKSTLVLVGSITAVVGVVLVLMRILGAGAPYHKGSKSFLVERTYSFAHTQREKAVAAAKACDMKALASLPQSEVPSITVVTYSLRNGEFAAVQAFAYEELEYRPLFDVVVKH